MLKISNSSALRELAPSQRPQERLEEFGASALSDSELLAMLLRSGSRKMDVLELATSIIQEAGSLAGLLRWDVTDLTAQHGVGKVKALQLLTREGFFKEKVAMWLIETAEDVYNLLCPRSIGIELNSGYLASTVKYLLKAEEVTQGTATASLVHPRETFRTAIGHGAAAVIVAHNHPSGDPSPSTADHP